MPFELPPVDFGSPDQDVLLDIQGIKVPPEAPRHYDFGIIFHG